MMGTVRLYGGRVGSINGTGRARRSGPGDAVGRSQAGFLLIEVLIALAILGIIATAFLSALTTGYRGLLLADEKTMAESLARTELERIRDAPYPIADEVKFTGGYDITVTPVFIQPIAGPVETADLNNLSTVPSGGLQMVTITVAHQGKTLLVTATSKANR
jgi:prepilin-type N-terminal cleavage/methylation domain-containing protein